MFCLHHSEIHVVFVIKHLTYSCFLLSATGVRDPAVEYSSRRKWVRRWGAGRKKKSVEKVMVDMKQVARASWSPRPWTMGSVGWEAHVKRWVMEWARPLSHSGQEGMDWILTRDGSRSGQCNAKKNELGECGTIIPGENWYLKAYFWSSCLDNHCGLVGRKEVNLAECFDSMIFFTFWNRIWRWLLCWTGAVHVPCYN